ncbi:MAG: LUD domain-containing protein [Clostridia bacterium]|nr:LUD domain-containing protein [Clostridia bacterium]
MDAYLKARKELDRDRGKQAVKALQANRMEALLAEDQEEACRYLLQAINPQKTVALGDSLTLKEMGIIKRLEERGQRVVNPFAVPGQDNIELMYEAFNCYYYLTGSNAVTLDGKILCVDSIGNRVAPMFFGPKEVFIVAGVNKLVENLEEGRKRIKEYAAPVNARRLGKNTPCITLPKCTDCSSEDRICNVEVILHKKPRFTKVTVLLINRHLGL